MSVPTLRPHRGSRTTLFALSLIALAVSQAYGADAIDLGSVGTSGGGAAAVPAAAKTSRRSWLGVA